MNLQDNVHLIAYCNEQAVIEEIIYQNEENTVDFKSGESIFRRIDQAYEKKGQALQSFFENKREILDYVLEIGTGRKEKKIVLHSFPMKQGCLVMIEQRLYCGEQCRETYEEIMKLNSKLTNTQREVAKKNQELKRMNEKLEALATRDALTGLYNRHSLEEKFEEEVKRCSRLDVKFSIAMVDFNNFKKVNDDLGHAAGDQLLKDFAKLALEETRTGFDDVFRIGGDEFLFLFENCSKKEAETIILRIEKELEKYTRIASLAFGILEVPAERNPKLDKLLAKADGLMYRNKRKKHQNS